MKKIKFSEFTFIIISFLLFQSFLFAQSEFLPEKKVRKNSTYLELGGKALLYSLNYERKFFIDEELGFAAGLGLEVPPFANPDYSEGGFRFVVLPFGRFFWQICSKHEIALRFGTGALFYSEDSPELYMNGFGADYTHYSRRKLFWGINLNFLSDPDGFLLPFPWVGFQIGFQFE